jgi:hypothetical protein
MRFTKKIDLEIGKRQVAIGLLAVTIIASTAIYKLLDR